MNFVELLNAWAAVWSDFMVRAFIDTAALLALIVVVWLPVRRRVSAQLAHGVFCLVLLKLIVPVPITWGWWQPWESAQEAVERVSAWAHPGERKAPALKLALVPPVLLPLTGDLGSGASGYAAQQPVVLSAPASASAVSQRGASAMSPLATASRVPASLSVATWLMIGWACCTILLLARFCRAMKMTQKMMREAVPLCPESLCLDVDALGRAVGLRGPVRWGVNFDLNSPAVGGLLRPAVILPPDLGESLSPKQLTWVLLHELAHIRRGDLWVVVVQRVVQAVFFFHPAVHLANWIIDELREYACDDAALAACKTSRRVCGEGFLAIVERSVERAPVATAALGLFESRLLIRRRLIRILDDRRTIHARLSPRGVCGLLVLGLFVLAVGRPADVAAHLHGRVHPPRIDVARLLGPASFRPGALWRRETRPDVRAASDGKTTPHGSGAILALAYSPDGSTVAAAGDDAVVVLRDAATGRVAGRLEGHRDAVACLSFSPDGKTLATGSYDRSVKLWDVKSGRARATLTGHTNWVFSVAFSGDGGSLASAGHDKMVRVWDVRAGRETATLAGHSASVRAVAFAPGRSGRLVASGGADRVVKLWDLSTRSPLAQLRGHKGTVRAMAFTADGSMLATASEDGEVKLWDMPSGHERCVLLGHSDMVTCLAFMPRGALLATGSLDKTVKLWETATGRERASLDGNSDGVSALAFAPGGRQMATGGFGGTVQMWEPATPAFSPAACLAYPGDARSLDFSPDGRSLRAAGSAGTARWDAITGSPLAPAIKDDATAFARAFDGATYATGGSDGVVRLFDSATDRKLATFEGHEGAVRSIAFSPAGRLAATGGNDGIVRFWDYRAHQELGWLPALPLPVTRVQFSPDGQAIAISTGDERTLAPDTITLWDIKTGRPRGVLSGHEGGITSVAFSPDGTTVASAGADGIVRLWDASSLSPRDALKYGPCASVAFSPDGRYLASAHKNGDVVIWDALDACQVGLLKGHRDVVLQVVFSPDGRSLATAGKDHSVKLWSLAARRQTARATLRGDLTPVWSLAYSPDGKMLAVADGPQDAPGTVTLWDAATRKVKTILDGHQRGVGTVAFSPDGKRLASGGREGTIRIWDTSTGDSVHELTGLSGVTELAYSPDGTLLASAGEGNSVTLWDVASGTEEARLTGFRWPVQCVAFSPDGTLLATGGGAFDNRPGAEGEVKLWDVKTRSVAMTLDGHTRGVVAAAFSPDGTRLATGGIDETIRVWDVRKGKQQLIMSGLSSCVSALAFSRDGRMLAWSGRADGLVSLRDATTGAEAVRLIGHGALVRGIAFASDRTTLATGGADRTVKLWDVASLPLSTRP